MIPLGGSGDDAREGGSLQTPGISTLLLNLLPPPCFTSHPQSHTAPTPGFHFLLLPFLYPSLIPPTLSPHLLAATSPALSSTLPSHTPILRLNPSAFHLYPPSPLSSLHLSHLIHPYHPHPLALPQLCPSKFCPLLDHATVTNRESKFLLEECPGLRFRVIGEEQERLLV